MLQKQVLESRSNHGINGPEPDTPAEYVYSVVGITGTATAPTQEGLNFMGI